MIFTLKRTILTSRFTLGEISEGGTFLAFSLEDQVRPEGSKKVKGETAIPFGVFEIQLRFSQRFKMLMPYLKLVPNFSAVMIHTGNRTKDTAGCVLVGLTCDAAKGEVRSSREAFHLIMGKILDAKQRKEKVEIQIVRGEDAWSASS